ncbi:MAG: S-adenosylmethionine decarboxylase [Candidatus Hermodarchaeia archaeon]|jgi:hypothetical protein
MVYNKHFPNGDYGLEATIDFHGCDTVKITTDNLKEFVTQVIRLSDMKPHGDPVIWEDLEATEPHLTGISIFQWIQTSDIVIHALTTGLVLFNLFSCKPFDPQQIADFGKDFWKANKVDLTTVTRGKLSA